MFPRRSWRRFDVLGFLTIAGGLFALLLAVTKGEDWGWSSYRVLSLLSFSVLSLALFVVIELEVDDPLLDVRVFRYRAFSQSVALFSMLVVVMFGALYYIPQFLQVAQGWGALDSGLTLLPQALVMAVLMPTVGRIYDRFGPRWPVFIGMIIVALGSYLLHTITIDTTRTHVMWLLAVQAVGIGLSMMPIMTGGIAVIPLSLSNTASAYNNVVRNVAGALGVAMFTAILTIQQAQMMTGRSALLPANAPPPHLGPPGTPDWLSAYFLYRQTNLQVFVGAIDNLFLIGGVMAGLGALVALTLRSGPAPAAVPMAPAAPASDSAHPPDGMVRQSKVRGKHST
jgi:EmrB/QacA subfamily drug resistance transporter